MLVCTLGDLLLDVIVRLEQPLARSADADSVVHLGPGGQAANVAAWVAELGGTARLIAKRGDDDAAAIASCGLAERGVDLVGPVGGRNGVVVSLVDPDGDRSMASDRGVAPSLEPGEIEPAWLSGVDVLHVSGYSLLRAPIDAAALRAIGLACEAGSRVSVDLSSWSAIRDFGPAAFRERLEAIAPDVVFANEDEQEILGGPLPGSSWILKLGARGCRFDGVELPARPAVPVDSTGAGDALAAGYLLGGPDLALDAAARCVSQLGSMP